MLFVARRYASADSAQFPPIEASDPLIQVVFRMIREKERIACVQEDKVFVGIIDRNDIINHILRA